MPTASLLLIVIAGFEVTPLLGDHAVVQQQQPIPVWGTGEPGDTIDVRLSGNSPLANSTTVEGDGSWFVELGRLPASATPLTLTVTDGADTWTAHDVLVGELWLASGQSNMEWRVGQSDDRNATASEFTNTSIREFKVPHAFDDARRSATGGTWVVAGPDSTPQFSGVAWNFARMLQAKLKVPIGIVNSSWGGSSVEAWMDRDLLNAMRAEDERVARSVDTWFASQDAKATDAAEVFSLDHDVSDWNESVVPGDWASIGLGDVDGVVLYRVSIWLPASWEGKDVALSLGPIDDIDETYWDGEKIGGLSNHAAPRNYTVPGRLVTPGRHVIGVRNIDNQGAGGFFGKRGDLWLHPVGEPKNLIGLAGPWRWQQSSGWTRPARNTPTVLNNAMIAPLEPLPFAGAIWYQGESNAHDPEAYDVLFPAMIEDWRDRFGSALPFYFVQLANLDHRRDNWHWPQLREAQRRALRLDDTGMALCFDVGNPTDIHPTDKRTVGRRLGRHALNHVYSQPIVPQGPRPLSLELPGDGTAIVKFEMYGGALHTRNGGAVELFEIAGDDGVFHRAQVGIIAGRLIARSSAVPEPVAVRYGWRQDPAAANLLGADELPATPFALPSTVSVGPEGAAK